MAKKQSSHLRGKPKRIKSIFKRGILFFFIFLAILISLTIVQVLSLRFFNPPYTIRIAFSKLQHFIISKPYEEPSFFWKNLSDISPHLKKAVLASEDQRFLTHHGFDLVELNRAVRDVLAEKRIRGASTITMQVARTVFLWHSRSLFRKIAEAYYTVLIELLWTKDRIFEIYLNTVDWGPKILGAEAASKKYFNIGSDRISRSQAALLAAILPSPHKWSPQNPNDRVRQRQKRILKDIEKMPLL